MKERIRFNIQNHERRKALVESLAQEGYIVTIEERQGMLYRDGTRYYVVVFEHDEDRKDEIRNHQDEVIEEAINDNTTNNASNFLVPVEEDEEGHPIYHFVFSGNTARVVFGYERYALGHEDQVWVETSHGFQVVVTKDDLENMLAVLNGDYYISEEG